MHHNISMFTTGNTHLKYRKHPVHSAARKLKIRSSRLVLTTAGTDLDSTERAAKNSSGELKIGGAKNSSASEQLKRLREPPYFFFYFFSLPLSLSKTKTKISLKRKRNPCSTHRVSTYSSNIYWFEDVVNFADRSW